MRTARNLDRCTTLLALALLLLATACSGGSGKLHAPDGLPGKAAALTDLLAKNDWPAVRKDFDATMASGLSEAQLAAAWKQVVALKGAYRSRGEPRLVDQPVGVFVFDTPMQFERAPMKSRITFDRAGKVAGLFIVVPTAH